MKYYFKNANAEECYSLNHFKDEMAFDRITEMTVFEAIQEKANGYFYCNFYNEIGEVGQSCGKQCIRYSPRNNRKGICKQYRRLYIHGKQITIKI